jgi:hypothetical protein
MFLLSFAQFEREVIGERVRDKIAASKKKGLFMGGNIPLGYTNRDKKLVIVREEADRVRWIFQRYLELGSIGRLLEEMNRLGIWTKVQTLANGKRRGGVAYGVGALAYLLKNPCYVGEIRHRGQIHAAEHEPIVDRATFDAVQASFNANVVARRVVSKASPFLLQGLLYDSAGNRMTPSHSRKKGARYRYYVSQAVLQSRNTEAGLVTRVPAPEIEALIERYIRHRCRDPHSDLRYLVKAQIARITVQRDSISVVLAGLESASAETADQSRNVVSLPWTKKPFRAIKGVDQEAPRPGQGLVPEQVTLAAIGTARRWVQELTAGRTLADVAREEGKGERHIRMLIPLAFVPPAAVGAIIAGRAPRLSNADIPKTSLSLGASPPAARCVWHLEKM